MSILMPGLTFVPPAVAVVVFATLGAGLMPRVGDRPIVVTGALLGVAGFALLSSVGSNTSFVTVVGSGILLLRASSGMVWPAARSTATAGVAPADAGAAGGMVNVGQQVAGAVAVGVPTRPQPEQPLLITGLTTRFSGGWVLNLAVALVRVRHGPERERTT